MPPPDGVSTVDSLPAGFTAPGWFNGSTTELVRFDGQVGFAAVSDGDQRGLYRSGDGGVSWQRLGVDATPFGVAFSPGRSRLWAVGNATAFVSADDGISFASLSLPEDFYGSAELWDAVTGVVTSETGDVIYQTSDAGMTWSSHAFTRDVLPGTHRTATLQDQLWIVGGPSFTSNGTGAHVAHSPDRGSTWETFSLSDSIAHQGGSLLAAAPISASNVWAVGENGQVFHTTDGFATWTQIATLPDGVLHVCAVTVQGETVRLAVTTTTHRYGIVESNDGGGTFTWTAQLPAPDAWDAEGIRGLTMLPSGGYAFYGYAGLFYVHS
jgi:photosystem II stability/assembly factor-like uncharacterized protein